MVFNKTLLEIKPSDEKLELMLSQLDAMVGVNAFDHHVWPPTRETVERAKDYVRYFWDDMPPDMCDQGVDGDTVTISWLSGRLLVYLSFHRGSTLLSCLDYDGIEPYVLRYGFNEPSHKLAKLIREFLE